MKLLILVLTLSFTSLGGVHGQEVRYVYDLYGRLIEAHYGESLTILYVYDLAGNLLAKRTGSFQDSDGDGMDDAWELAMFGNLEQTAEGDFDADGFNNLAEFLARTDPRKSASLLRVTAQKQVAGLKIEWPSVAGKSYQVQYKEDLSVAEWTNLDGVVTATGDFSSVVDTSAGSKRFYRVVLGDG